MWVNRAELRRLLLQLREQKERIASLEAELRTERARSQRREDELVDRVLTASGRHALTPEPKPIAPKEPPTAKPLTALEEARLFALREAAKEAGRPVKEADDLFYAQRNGIPFQVGQPDEPYILPT